MKRTRHPLKLKKKKKRTIYRNPKKKKTKKDPDKFSCYGFLHRFLNVPCSFMLRSELRNYLDSDNGCRNLRFKCQLLLFMFLSGCSVIRNSNQGQSTDMNSTERIIL